MCDLKNFLTLADARYERGKEGENGGRRGEGRGGEGRGGGGGEGRGGYSNIRFPQSRKSYRGTSLIVSIKLRFQFILFILIFMIILLATCCLISVLNSLLAISMLSFGWQCISTGDEFIK
jgi:hypothetical protein